MSRHLGDFDASAVVYDKFTTYRPSTGAPFTLAGSPVLSVYKDNSTTQSTAGVTLTVDFDSVTGLNHFAIDTSADGAFYAAGSFFDVVITTGTVDSISSVGSVVGSFTIRKNSTLKPTTAGRTLDVSAGGEAGVDWSNVGSPTTALNLTGTTISTSQVAASVTAGVTVATNSDKTGYSLSGTQTFNVTGNITGNLSGSVGSVSGAVGSVTGAVGSVTGAVASVTGNVGGNVVGSVGSIATNGITRASFAADTGLQTIRSNTAQAGASTTITLDASASSVNDFYKNDLIFITGGTGVGQARFCTAYVGTTKVATVTAWATNPDATSTFAVIAFDAIPGATAPTAAAIRTEMDTNSTQLAKLGSPAGASMSADIAAINAKTTNLPASPASTTNITGGTITTATNLTNLPTIPTNWLTAAGLATDAVTEIQSGLATSAVQTSQGTTLNTIAGYLDTEVAAIKAKTDNLPASPAATGDAMTLTSGERTSIADATLGRSVATIESTAAEWSLASMILAAFESSISGTTWTIKRTDGTTVHLTKTVATNAAADPITGVS